MSKSRTPRPTDAELEILRVLWGLGPSTVREVHQALSPRKRTSYNTTLKLLQIMNHKGIVTRRESRRPQVYRPAVSERRMQRRLLRDLLERAFGGSAGKLVAALTETDISDEELAEIRRLLAGTGEKQP
jgi:predicted transcriptional regulator